MATGDSVPGLLSEIAAATSIWNNVSTSRLRVKFGGYTKQDVAAIPQNPMGIVAFSDSIPPGAAAVGGPIFQIPSGTPQFFPIGYSRVQIPSDMRQNSSFSNGYLPVLTHEIGHSLGAHHSHVGSLMYQTRITSRAAPLTDDDIAFISSDYPAPAFLSSYGTISGKVNTVAGPGASLVGVSAFSDTTIIGAVTMPDGTFTIQGLPPGTYRLMVQPLMLGAAPSSSADNPGDPSDLISTRTLTNAVVHINTDIDSVFFGAGGASVKTPATAATFQVGAGQTIAGANVTVGARGPLRSEVNRIVSFPGNSNISSNLLWARRNVPSTVITEGRALDAASTTIGFTASGLSIAPGLTQNLNTSATIFNSVLAYTVNVASTAILGNSSAIFTNGSDTYFAAGQVRVVDADPPRIISITPTNGTTGTTVTITGTGFTDSSRVFFNGAQAAISSRSTTSLVITTPPGAPGIAAAVFVANSDGQGSEFGIAPPTFTYATTPQPLISLSPSSASPGQSLTVTVTGTNTNFQQGSTTLGFGSGDVIVDAINVNNPTSLTAQIHVQQLVGNQAFLVTALTGAEAAVLDGGLKLSVQLKQPYSLRPFSGDLQSGSGGAQLARPLVVAARDSNGVPIQGVAVQFTVTLGGGTVSPASAVTDAQGLAQTQMTLGSVPGVQIVLATADQFSSTGIMEFNGSTAGFALGYSLTGNAQTGPANADLPTPLSITVVDNQTRPLRGIPIAWIVDTGGGSIRPLSSVTDANGQVGAVWTLGPSTGSQTARAVPFFYDGISLYGFKGVTITATAQAAGGGVTPVVPATGILNGAGFDSSVAGVSPGAIVTIFGTNLSTAPSTGVQPGLIPGTTQLSTSSNGTRVTFDGVAAPLFFVSPGQLNVQVPFEVAGKASSQVVVTLNGSASSAVTVPVLESTPGIFTSNSSGKGPAVILNQDGSFNSSINPAPEGTIIQLFATGLGAVTPAVPTGQLAPTSLPLALSTTLPTVLIGGASSPANLEFSGLAPGFVGLWQVNVRVPIGAGSGGRNLLLRTGQQTANLVTVYVK